MMISIAFGLLEAAAACNNDMPLLFRSAPKSTPFSIIASSSFTPLFSTAIMISFEDMFTTFFSFAASNTVWFTESQFTANFSFFPLAGSGVADVDARRTNACTASAGLNSSRTTPQAAREGPQSRGEKENALL